MKRKVAAVIAAVVLVGLGVAVAIGGSGEDPLVAQSYLESTYPSALAQTLQKRASTGTKTAYDQAAAKLDKAGEADVKAAEKLQGTVSGYVPKAVKAGDTLTLSQGASMVVYSGTGAVDQGTLIDVTDGKTVAQKGGVTTGHRYIVTGQSVTVRVDAAGQIGVQGTVSIANGGSQGGETLPFTDVKSSDWYYGAVTFVYGKGYFSGTAADTFAPNSSMTRAMLATVLHRASGLEKPGSGESFADVPAGQWYSDGIAWASERKIVNGMGNGLYAPDLAVTREQLVTMLYRYQTDRKGNVSAKGSLVGYPDGNTVADWAKTAMEWAVGAELVKGRDTGYLDPKGTATRAEVATILQRFEALG